MSELYKLAFMIGLTGGTLDDTDSFFCYFFGISSRFLDGYGDGLEVRLSYYKPNLYN